MFLDLVHLCTNSALRKYQSPIMCSLIVEAVVFEEGGGISVITKSEDQDLSSLSDVKNLPADARQIAERHKPAA
jgi:hypothetical protein